MRIEDAELSTESNKQKTGYPNSKVLIGQGGSPGKVTGTLYNKRWNVI